MDFDVAVQAVAHGNVIAIGQVQPVLEHETFLQVAEPERMLDMPRLERNAKAALQMVDSGMVHDRAG